MHLLGYSIDLYLSKECGLQSQHEMLILHTLEYFVKVCQHLQVLHMT